MSIPPPCAATGPAIRVDPGLKPESRNQAHEIPVRLFEASRSLPGVRSAALTSYLPFGRSQNAGVITIEGYTRAPGENPPVPGWNAIDPDYFRTLGIPLLRGRAFAESDAGGAPLVAIIDRFLARKYWPNSDPIGAKIRRGIEEKDPLVTVVGVVGSVKVSDLADRNPVGQI